MITKKSLIIRNDHDELLILLERYRMKKKNIINYDRHSDLYANSHVDVGSWGHYGLKWGIIDRFIWMPAPEALSDHIRRWNSLRRIGNLKHPVILSICYDYFIGKGMKRSLEIKSSIKKMMEQVRHCDIEFIFAARSPQWCEVPLIGVLEDNLREILEKNLDYVYSESLSQHL